MKQTFNIDPAHSSANFSVRHLMISNVRGSFGKVTGTVVHDFDNPSNSTIQAEIDANSLNTGDPQRDTHVKSPDFLHVEQHPKITFQSTKVEQTGDGELKVTGDLTLHGVTKQVVLTVDGPTSETKDPWGDAEWEPPPLQRLSVRILAWFGMRRSKQAVWRWATI